MYTASRGLRGWGEKYNAYMYMSVDPLSQLNFSASIQKLVMLNGGSFHKNEGGERTQGKNKEEVYKKSVCNVVNPLLPFCNR